MLPTDRYPAVIRDALSLIPTTAPKTLVAPPLHRMSWAAGVPLPPPLMAGALRNFLYFGIVFGVLFGLAMALLAMLAGGQLTHVERSLGPMTLAAGFGYGVLMALIFEVNARRHGVPRWSDMQGLRETPPSR